MESRRCSMSANVNLCNQKRRHPEPAAHLCDIVPHAPCLLVRMLRIFCFSWLAVTWSLCLAALMRWSHIFSSSLRSAAYWAQLDWRRSKVRYNAGVLKEDDQIWLLGNKKRVQFLLSSYILKSQRNTPNTSYFKFVFTCNSNSITLKKIPLLVYLPQIQHVCEHPLPAVCSGWTLLRWQLAQYDPSSHGTEVWQRGEKQRQEKKSETL